MHATDLVGEQPFGAKQSPVLISDGVFDSARVAEEFRSAAAEIDPEIAGLVYDRLVNYPG